MDRNRSQLICPSFELCESYLMNGFILLCWSRVMTKEVVLVNDERVIQRMTNDNEPSVPFHVRQSPVTNTSSVQLLRDMVSVSESIGTLFRTVNKISENSMHNLYFK
jgi:hypothetical protein